jgi:hypothetical protein
LGLDPAFIFQPAALCSLFLRFQFGRAAEKGPGIYHSCCSAAQPISRRSNLDECGYVLISLAGAESLPALPESEVDLELSAA